MSTIKDIQSILRHRRYMGFPEVNVVAMDIDKLNTLFLEFQDMHRPTWLGDSNIKSRLDNVNALMRNMDLPEIALLQ